METVERREAVKLGDFVQAIVEGAKEGKTAKEVAEKLGMPLNSFRVRLASVRKQVEKQNKADGKNRVLPKLPRAKGVGGTREETRDALNSLLEAVN